MRSESTRTLERNGGTSRSLGVALPLVAPACVLILRWPATARVLLDATLAAVRLDMMMASLLESIGGTLEDTGVDVDCGCPTLPPSGPCTESLPQSRSTGDARVAHPLTATRNTAPSINPPVGACIAPSATLECP